MEVGLESKVVSAAAAGVVDGIPADFGFAEAMDCPHAASATSPEGDISEPVKEIQDRTQQLKKRQHVKKGVKHHVQCQ